MNANLGPLSPGRLSVGITGHRSGNAVYAAHAPEVRRALEQVFLELDQACRRVWRQQGIPGRIELYSLLADGVDQDAANAVRLLGWPVIAPLPFGRHLNAALNAEPSSEAEARRMLGGRVPHGDLALERFTRLEQEMALAEVIEAPEADQAIAAAWLRSLSHDSSAECIATFDALVSERYARAALVMMRQVSLLVAVWDGRGSDAVGGTGHCLRVALERGLPALWINPGHAASWRVVRAWEDTLEEGVARECDREALGALLQVLLLATA